MRVSIRVSLHKHCRHLRGQKSLKLVTSPIKESQAVSE